MPDVFTKNYRHESDAHSAGRHHQWLASLSAPVPLLHGVTRRELRLQAVTGHHARPHDLAAVATVLGRLHGTAFLKELHTARLPEDFITSSGLALSQFAAPRLARLDRHKQEGLVSSDDHAYATEAITRASDQAAALYKDANLRNVLMTPSGPVLVDFDDLTLAPFGYDLAKLLISAAMTYGCLPRMLYAEALNTYNESVKAAGGPTRGCTWDALIVWLDVQHTLTSPYLGTNGYQHSWRLVRPW